MKQHLGFSLLELLLVVALIGILAAIGTPVYLNHVEAARQTDAKNSLSAIAMKQEEVLVNEGAYFISATSNCNATNSNALQDAMFGIQNPLSMDSYCYYTEVPTDANNANGFVASACRLTATDECFTIDNLNNKVGW